MCDIKFGALLCLFVQYKVWNIEVFWYVRYKVWHIELLSVWVVTFGAIVVLVCKMYSSKHWVLEVGKI